MIAADTSVAVAAALPWHEAHDAAQASLGDEKTPLLAQVAIETFSVLTRLPRAQRVSPGVAREYLLETFVLPPIPLSAEGHTGLFELAEAQRISGGAVYDALVAATAREAGATLVSLDHRAAATYRLVGVDYRMVA